TSVTPASSAPVLQTPKATSSTLYFDSLTVNAGNGGFLHCIQMDTSVNAANQVVSVGADIAFDADPKDRKSGSAGMPRPISYAVFCLKKKISKSFNYYMLALLSRTAINEISSCAIFLIGHPQLAASYSQNTRNVALALVRSRHYTFNVR